MKDENEYKETKEIARAMGTRRPGAEEMRNMSGAYEETSLHQEI